MLTSGEIAVQVDQEIQVNECPPTVPWNLDRLDDGTTPDASRDYYPASRGQGTTVFVFDTGIYKEHSEFQTASGSKV